MVLTYFHKVARSWTWLSDWTELNMKCQLNASKIVNVLFTIFLLNPYLIVVS